ncbi:hypothetical protein QF023_003480 [Chryseobacterium sp. SLBN-27]|jgi:hypothetical protein|uniref:hypothetical protein n=1 Tax=Chryseobacterium sp. SLBN-27 TaxID=3042287 RepID=UPI00285B33B5|nr:hypothetical protein [Chryseobacterium sp. SLBN-27]MDR6159964.1 hypothetical protein [Chryseobacterium sp. SLBN-27]
MKNNIILIQFIAFAILLHSCTSGKNIRKNNPDHVWTFTYLKAQENQKTNLKIYIEKNWFAMDHTAVKQGLLGQYELYENKDPGNKDWDFIVAVEYLTTKGYDDIATEFEAIRSRHQIIKINGLDMKGLGKVVKSETLSKKRY